MKFILLLTILSLNAAVQANKFSFDNAQLADFMAKMNLMRQVPIIVSTTEAPFVAQNNQMFQMPQTQQQNAFTMASNKLNMPQPVNTMQDILNQNQRIQSQQTNSQPQLMQQQIRMAGQQQQEQQTQPQLMQQQKSQPQLMQQQIRMAGQQLEQQSRTTDIPQREPLDKFITDKCINIENGKLIAHPTSNRKFIVCDSNIRSVVVMDCPDNLLFNTFAERCDNNLFEPLRCSSDPCQNNGKCIDTPNKEYKCECALGWAGKNCARKDVCSALPCGQEGICIPTPMGSPIDHFCLCSNGIQFGVDCQANNVEQNPCFQSNSVFQRFSVKANPSAYVHCDGQIPHFKFCPNTLVFSPHNQSCVSVETKSSEGPWTMQPVKNEVMPVMEPLTAKYCNKNKMGDLKPHPADKTMFVVCQSEAEFDIMKCPNSLVFNPHTLTCNNNMRMPEMGCSSNPCENNGKCIDLPLFKYKCECAIGFMGKNCQRADVCATSMCGNQGVCLPLPTGSPINHFCLCEMGNSFGLTCNSQATEPNPCLNARDFNTQMFALKSNPGIFVHCDGQLPHLKFCQYPLVFSKSKQQCFWTKD